MREAGCCGVRGAWETEVKIGGVAIHQCITLTHFCDTAGTFCDAMRHDASLRAAVDLGASCDARACRDEAKHRLTLADHRNFLKQAKAVLHASGFFRLIRRSPRSSLWSMGADSGLQLPFKFRNL